MMLDSYAASSLASLVAEGMTTSQAGERLGQWWRERRTGLVISRHGGEQAARSLADDMDRMILRLASLYGDGTIAILALGGYGRGRLAPYSDVDLLFLSSKTSTDRIAEGIMYALWDSGVDLSQTAHSVDSALAAARTEAMTLSSFLTARLLCGDPSSAEKFFDFRDSALAANVGAFIRYKIEERRQRLSDHADQAYAVEHDIKESEGGLRDLDTIRWLSRSLETLRTGLGQSVLTRREAQRLKRCASLLWSVRVGLHRLRERADDRLAFDVQPPLAEALGYVSGGIVKTDRFLRHFFLTTKDVAIITRRVLARTGDRLADLGVATETPRQLTLTTSSDDPIRYMEVFELMAEKDRAIHPHALAEIASFARQHSYQSLQKSPLGLRFVALLARATRLEPVLRAMAECGFLGRMLPSFGAVVGKAEYGLFRRFTLDEHIMKAIGALDASVAETDHELVALMPSGAASRHRVAVALALLLQEAPARRATSSLATVCNEIRERIGLLSGDDRLGDLVAFLVLEQALLVRTLARRRLHDPVVVARVADRIGDRERLAALSVFTACRQRTAGVGSWEQYKRRDVTLLTDLVAAALEGGETAVLAYLGARDDAQRREAAQGLPHDQSQALRAVSEATGPLLWSLLDIDEVRDLAALVATVEATGAMGKAVCRVAADGTLDIIVYTDDSAGLLAQCAGYVATVGGSVFSAAAVPMTERTATDVGRRAILLMQAVRTGTPPRPFRPSSGELRRIEAGFSRIARGEDVDLTVPPPSILDRRQTFTVAPKVTVHQETADDALVVEVEALDRPGLLFLLARGLTEIGVEIVFASVATFGHRAVDTFYLRDQPGYKIEDERRIEAIRRRLIRSLDGV